MKQGSRIILLGALLVPALEPRASAAVCSPTLFVEAPAYGVGHDPIGLAVGDFNDDTIPDIATANYQDATVTVLLGNGDGTFQPAIASDTEESGRSIAAADFDGDGHLDVAVGSYSRVAVLLGNGNGTFDAPVHYNAGNGTVWSVVAADLNPGGAVDLVVATDWESSVEVLLGVGDGTFEDAVAYPAGGQTRSVAPGDFDGNGTTDLVAANLGGNTVSLLLGFGDGTFAAPLPFVAGTAPTYLVAADFDGDGDLDVAATTEGYVSVLKGNGSGSFGAAVQYPAPYLYHLVAADFSGDGFLDLASLDTYSSRDRVVILVGDGLGHFALTGSAFLGGNSMTDLTVSDFDGDGRLDLAVPNVGPDTVSLLFGTGEASFLAARSVDMAANSSSLAPGDYNGDGILDLAAAGSYEHDVVVLLGDGGGGFLPSFEASLDRDVTFVVSGDFTGDGILDLVVLIYYDGYALLEGLGDGTFEPPQPIVFIGSYLQWATVGDFDGDGALDFAVASGCCSDGVILVLLGRGDGTFDAPVPYETPGDVTGILSADLDGDGDLDLAAASPGSNQAFVLLGNGAGAFAAPVGYPVEEQPRSVAAADVTGDGLVDLVTGNASSKNLSLLTGAGDGTFGPGPIVAVGTRVAFVAAADLDGDGLGDLATANDEAASSSVFLGMGGGKFAAPVVYTTDQGPTFVAVGDFVINGHPDLAIAAPTTGTITVLSNSQLGTGVLPSTGACVGEAGVLHVFASGFGPLGYQWRKDGVPLSDGGNISGATTATLTIDPAGPADEGDYDVVVTDLCTSVTSNISPFTVSTAPATPVIVIDSPPAPGFAGTASVPDTPGHVFTWTIGGDASAVLLSGQGSHQITFSAPIPGLVTLDVTEYSATGCGTSANSVNVPVDFYDVPPGHPFHANIVKIARAEITAGCGGGNYCPGDPVTRAQMAVFLLKGLHGADWVPDNVGSYFLDVPPGSFAAEWINYIAYQSITGGCGTNIYCPDNPVTRAQMAVFILKTQGNYYPPGGPQIFDDVPPGAFAYNFINEIYNQGITGGCSVLPKLYCPDGLVTRGQMAVFIDRAFLEP